MRDELVNAAFSGTALDREAVATILGERRSAGGKAPRTMGFSFTRRDSDPDRARSDLAAAVEIIAAAEEVEKALEDATERLKRDMTDEALEEQQRLITAQQGLRQRLASLPAPINGGRMAKNETQEVETVDKGDAPLLDLNDASVKKMMAARPEARHRHHR